MVVFLFRRLTSRVDFEKGLTVTDNTPNQIPQKLGILMIIIDDLPHEAIWRMWSELQLDTATTAETSSYSPSSSRRSHPNVSFFVHAKCRDEVKSNWVRERLVKGFQLQPGWGSVTLTEVMIRLLHEVSKHLNVYLFLVIKRLQL